MTSKWMLGLALGLLAIAGLNGCGNGGGAPGGTGSTTGTDGTGVAAPAGETVLLNVSYDPTRELWADLNKAFVPVYEKAHGGKLQIKQSHGGSGPQARAIIDGIDADVATLALWLDTDLLRQKKLLKDGWEERLPHRSLAYTSTVVFVVRKGNPKGIKDWADLVKPGVEVITPNPKTSGNGRMSFLGAWGSIVRNGGSEADAKAFITKLYKAVPKLDTGARGATTTFSQQGLGDVHLTWESEAYLEIAESKGELELIYPKQSIKAEPHIVVVDANVDRKKTRAAAEEYLKFLYTPEGQEIIAKHYYRPVDETVLEKHKDKFPKLDLYVATDLAPTWDKIQEKFFAEGAMFDSIYDPQSK